MVTADIELAASLAELARALCPAGPPEVARRVTTAAPVLVPGCQEAVMCLLDRHGGRVTVAATSAGASHADRLGHRSGDGPCLAAAIPVPPGPGAGPWRELGFRSLLAVPLTAGADVLGALTLAARTPDAFGPAPATIAGVLATHAGVALAAATTRERNAELTDALRSSRLIGMALGIVMAGRRVTPEQAFDLLRRCSRRRQRKLRDLAAEIVATGEVPDDGGPGGR